MVSSTAKGKLDRFTDRERDVLLWMGNGKSTKDIADQLGMSEHTAKFHTNQLSLKLGVKNRTSIVVMALKLGYLKLDELMVEHVCGVKPLATVTAEQAAAARKRAGIVDP